MYYRLRSIYVSKLSILRPTFYSNTVITYTDCAVSIRESLILKF